MRGCSGTCRQCESGKACSASCSMPRADRLASRSAWDKDAARERIGMASDFAIGCTYNFLQPHEEVAPLRRFEMVRDTGAFDYINWLPPSRILKECVQASEKTGIPMMTGNCGHQLGNDDPRLA